ncbi:MAG TPA: hypothetical protein VFV87_07480 [Pirellulaceae bacterium]|nr:hypothetical protein [Pirellulaceae bacterium]
MSENCDFSVTVKGDYAQLEDLLETALGPSVTLVMGRFYLDPGSAGVQIDEAASKQFVSLRDLRGDEQKYNALQLADWPCFNSFVGDWHILQTPRPMGEIDRINEFLDRSAAERLAMFDEFVKLVGLEYESSAALDASREALARSDWPRNRYRGLLDQPMPRLLLWGESDWGPPLIFQALAKHWPLLVFVAGGSTDCELYEEYEWSGDSERCNYRLIVNPRTDEVEWVVKDGVVISQAKWQPVR